MQKFLIIGHKQHGKDEACIYLRDHYGIRYISSSTLACELFIFDQMKDKYGYKNPYECYQDRDNHRKFWYDAICEYNKDDPGRLGRKIFSTNQIYCGLRDKIEFDALKRNSVFDLCIYIDASDRKPLEDRSSMTLTKQDADIIIDNNGTKEQLYEHLDRLFKFLRYTKR